MPYCTYFKSFSIDISFLIYLSFTMQLSIYGVVASATIDACASWYLSYLGGNKWTRTTDIIAYVSSALFPAHYRALVGTSGLEPPTSRLSGVCSNQLSYVPVFNYARWFRGFNPLTASTYSGCCLVEVSGIEPLTPCLQGRCSPS